MILLTNSAAQTVATGAAVTFDTVIFQTGNGECHRDNSAGVSMRCRGIYEVNFSADVSGTAPLELTIEAGGEPLPETVMSSASATAQNVSTMTALRNCCTGYERVTVVNTGANDVTVESPKLFVKRIA